MVIAAPIFWYHPGPRAHQLPDASFDVKGRAVLRKIRAGYATISPQRTASAEPALRAAPPTPPAGPRADAASGADAAAVEAQQQPPAPPATPATAVEEQQQQQQQQPPPTPPAYESLEPPPYARRPPAALPPTLPGYTPLPGVVSDPARDLGLPSSVRQRRRYREALMRRLMATKTFFGGDSSASEESEAQACQSERESTRGVVLYREDGHWAVTTDNTQDEAKLSLPRQRGLKAWLKRAWERFSDWGEVHPYLFILALFVIFVVVICVLI